jgi:hypothetical protein
MVSLVALPQAAQAQEGVGVEPEVGPPGTEFFFYADGFEPNEQVGVWINNPDGSVSSIVSGDQGNIFLQFADSDGSVDWYTTMSPDTPAGYYTMVAQGVESGVTHLIGFIIDPSAARQPGRTPPSDADAGVEPEVGPPGSSFAFFAEGFIGGEQVGIWINNPDGSVSRVLNEDGEDALVFADKDGIAAWVVTMSEGSPPGFYSMVAFGVDSGISHVIPYEIR